MHLDQWRTDTRSARAHGENLARQLVCVADPLARYDAEAAGRLGKGH